MKKKQMVITLILIFAMAMIVTACGKENDANESATVGSVIDRTVCANCYIKR